MILVAAHVIVIVLARLLFSVELPLVAAIALLLLGFAGVIPWTVAVRGHDGIERRESTRSFARAIRRVREVNVDRRILVRWLWA